jgi:hypothetical protein
MRSSIPLLAYDFPLGRVIPFPLLQKWRLFSWLGKTIFVTKKTFFATYPSGQRGHWSGGGNPRVQDSKFDPPFFKVNILYAKPERNNKMSVFFIGKDCI